MITFPGILIGLIFSYSPMTPNHPYGEAGKNPGFARYEQEKIDQKMPQLSPKAMEACRCCKKDGNNLSCYSELLPALRSNSPYRYLEQMGKQ